MGKKIINRILLVAGLIFFLIPLNSDAQGKPPEWISQLALEMNLELVYGDSFPYINPYGCSGGPIVTGLLYEKDDITNRYEYNEFVMFLTRKKINNYDYKDESLNLIGNFEYYLIFAKKISDSYKVDAILPEVMLAGISLLDVEIDIKLSKFSYLNNPELNGPSNISTKDLVNRPLISSCDSSTTILVYYKGKWLKYVRVDS